MPSRQSAVLELTARMEQAARRCDWDEVERLLAERAHLMDASACSRDRETVEVIVRSDRLVAELAADERERVRAELEKLAQGRRAVSAYRDSVD